MEAARRPIKHRMRSFTRRRGLHSVQPSCHAQAYPTVNEARIARARRRVRTECTNAGDGTNRADWASSGHGPEEAQQDTRRYPTIHKHVGLPAM